MAIRTDEAKQFIGEVRGLWGEVLGKVPPGKMKQVLVDKVEKPLMELVNELIGESRAPVLHLVGRSGHGKSSLINILANRPFAEVGDVRPTTSGLERYELEFSDTGSRWTVYDSRGLFETTAPDGASGRSPVEQLILDLGESQPDIIFYVITAPEVRSMQTDLEAMELVIQAARKTQGIDVPFLFVLTKADTIGDPREWPPEDHPNKAEQLQKLIDYMATDVLKTRSRPIDPKRPFVGSHIDSPSAIAILPVCSLPEEPWNIDTLSVIVADELPTSAVLDFVQGQRREFLTRKLASKVVLKFSGIAGLIGATPIPVADIAVLTPLQLLMIAIVGGLSCRPVSMNTAFEYLSAAGVAAGAAIGLREAARQVVKIIPGLGDIISGAVAAAGTYGVGKSAEAYFFSGKVVKPATFADSFEGLKEA